jgi:hypothetical protein
MAEYYYDQLMYYYKVLKLSFKEAVKKAQADTAERLKEKKHDT